MTTLPTVLVILGMVALIGFGGFFMWSTRPSKQRGTTAKDSVLYTWQWKQAAILGAGPMLTAMVAWQLWTLDPKHWCKVATEDGFEAAQQIEKLETCKEMLLEILNLKDHALIGMMVILGGIIGMLTVSEFKTRLKASGPGGSSIEIGRDGGPTV